MTTETQQSARIILPAITACLLLISVTASISGEAQDTLPVPPGTAGARQQTESTGRAEGSGRPCDHRSVALHKPLSPNISVWLSQNRHQGGLMRVAGHAQFPQATQAPAEESSRTTSSQTESPAPRVPDIRTTAAHDQSVERAVVIPQQPSFPASDVTPTSGHCPLPRRARPHCPPHRIPWEIFAQGEYIGPARLPHVPEYRLRVDDLLEFVYRIKGEATLEPYRLNVADELRVESVIDEDLTRDLIIQPDGTITIPQVGQVPAANRTLDELRQDLNVLYSEFVLNPSIVVTPLKMNSTLEELRASIDARFGAGGQRAQARVTPEGTVQLPAIGSVPAQGLRLDELQAEIEYRYSKLVNGIEVTPVLIARAPRFIYVTGEVAEPGRYTLEAPTSIIQAIALAGSWNVGADLRNIIVLRRDENWNLMAVRLDLHDPLFGRHNLSRSHIWLRDSDIVLLPKSDLLWHGDIVDLIFRRVIYSILPVNYGINLADLTTI